MRLRKASLALGAIIVALAGASASDSASAQSGGHPPGSSFKLYDLSLSAAASGIPQALPSSKMSRSIMGGRGRGSMGRRK